MSAQKNTARISPRRVPKAPRLIDQLLVGGILVPLLVLRRASWRAATSDRISSVARYPLRVLLPVVGEAMLLGSAQHQQRRKNYQRQGLSTLFSETGN